MSEAGIGFEGTDNHRGLRKAKQMFEERAAQTITTVTQARELGEKLGRKIKGRAPAELLTG